MVKLAIRLGRLPHEIEALQIHEILEIIAVLKESDEPQEPDVEESLLKVFGKKRE